MSSRRQKRKRKRRAQGPTGERSAGGGTVADRDAGPEPESFSERYRARSEARNEAARAKLEPLDEGERPIAVTVGAVVAALLGGGNLIAYLAGLEVRGDRPSFAYVVVFSGILLVMAFGMWRARYWAVLGMQTLLGLVIVIFALSGFVAEDLWGVLLVLGVVIPSGALFWFLVRALARIQMPERP